MWCKSDPDAAGKEGMTLHHYAAAKGSTDVLQYLIKEGKCDPMVTDGMLGGHLFISAVIENLNLLLLSTYCQLVSVTLWLKIRMETHH